MTISGVNEISDNRTITDDQFFDDSFDLLTGSFKDELKDTTISEKESDIRPRTGLTSIRPLTSQASFESQSKSGILSSPKTKLGSLELKEEFINSERPITADCIKRLNSPCTQLIRDVLSSKQDKRIQSLGSDNSKASLPSLRPLTADTTNSRSHLLSQGRVKSQPQLASEVQLSRPQTSSRYDLAKESGIGSLSVVSKPQTPNVNSLKQKQTMYSDTADAFLNSVGM